MKKFFSVVLALVLVCSLGVGAFAVGSPTKDVKDDEVTAALPEAVFADVTVGDATVNGLAICDAATDEAVAVVPADEVKLTAVADAEDDLSEEDAAKFLEEYEKVKAVDDKVVKYFFWLAIPESYSVGEETYLKFVFNCEGENVAVTVDGEPMEVVAVEGEADSYFAKLTKLGAVAILCDAAE